MTTAIAYTEFGDPDVLHVIEAPDPVPGPGEVAVEVSAAGVNPIDVKLRSGVRTSAPITTPGMPSESAPMPAAIRACRRFSSKASINNS